LQAVGTGAVALVDGDADPGPLEAVSQTQASGSGADDDYVKGRGWLGGHEVGDSFTSHRDSTISDSSY
jgi:hypothetical protein